MRIELQRRGERLKDLDRQSIASDDRARRGADQPGDPIADAAWRGHPAGAVPAADQQLAPFVGEHPRHARLGRDRQRPKRVAIEINDALRHMEERARLIEVGHPACPLGSLGASLHLGDPPAHANKQKPPIPEEFWRLSLECVADELQDPAGDKRPAQIA